MRLEFRTKIEQRDICLLTRQLEVIENNGLLVVSLFVFQDAAKMSCLTVGHVSSTTSWRGSGR
jgi:hypothetical protein